jgi:hypothetical protein
MHCPGSDPAGGGDERAARADDDGVARVRYHRRFTRENNGDLVVSVPRCSECPRGALPHTRFHESVFGLPRGGAGFDLPVNTRRLRSVRRKRQRVRIGGMNGGNVVHAVSSSGALVLKVL